MLSAKQADVDDCRQLNGLNIVIRFDPSIPNIVPASNAPADLPTAVHASLYGLSRPPKHR